MQARFSIAWAPRREGCDESSGPMTMEGLCHDDVTTKAWRRPHWQRHDDEATTARRRSDDRDKPGLGVQPQLMTCHKPGLGAEPGLMTRQTPACDGRRRRGRIVVASLSCSRYAVGLSPSCGGTSSSCCRAIVVTPSAQCRRAVISIVITIRRDFSYPASACLLNFVLNRTWTLNNMKESQDIFLQFCNDKSMFEKDEKLWKPMNIYIYRLYIIYNIYRLYI